MPVNSASTLSVLFDSQILHMLIDGQILRISVLMIIMIWASVRDIRTRTVPDLMPVFIAAVSLIPYGHPYVLGILVAVPLLLAGVIYGGIGGGDVKVVGAVGLVLGFERTLAGLIIALIFLLGFHMIRRLPVFVEKRRISSCLQNCDNSKREKTMKDSYPMIPFLTVGMFISFLLFLFIF